MNKKSIFFVNYYLFISGVDINTFSFPPNYYFFAKMSPKLLDTDKPPGYILKGNFTFKKNFATNS